MKLTQILLKSHKQFKRKNKSMLQIQQRFKSQTHNIFTEETSKIALSSNERMQPIDSIFDRIKFINNTIKR